MAFKVTVEIISRRLKSKTNTQYTEKGSLVRFKSINSRLELIKYLDTYHLLSYKYLDYLSLTEAQDLGNKKRT
jgi:hypothetical protein